MSEKWLLGNMAGCVILLVVVLCLESFTDMDMLVQRRLYDATTRAWLLDADWHARLKPWLYVGPKIFLGVLGVGCVLKLIRFLRKQGKICRPALVLLLSLALVPACIAGGKRFTNIYCPYELREFGGSHVYQRVLSPADPANRGLARGRGFPAGHASGGFALMAFFFSFRSRRGRLMGLVIGLGAGWGMGWYQMIRGAHFLSHTLFSMVAAWLLICLIVLLVRHCLPSSRVCLHG